jgi:phospholipase/carboxylesterase
LTLKGFFTSSQGAILSYAIALSHPEKISKVIALSGYLNEEIIEENYRNNDFSKLNILHPME